MTDMTDFLRATFEEYCKERWEMSRPRAYQLIEAAEVMSNLSTIVDIPADECPNCHSPKTRWNPADEPPDALWQMNTALLAIRDGRGYRFEYATFEEYCRERWGMNRAHAYRLIDAAEVVNNLSPIGDIPANESQARPLTQLNDNPALQREACQRARKKRAVSFPCASRTTFPRVHTPQNEFSKVIQIGLPNY